MPLARARTSTFEFFALNGFVLGMWVVHIPEILERTGADKATLGYLLLLAAPVIGCVLAGLLAPSSPAPGHLMKSLSELVAPDWAEALGPVAANIEAMGQFLRAEIAAGHSYLPAGDNILRAFAEPMADVKVLITGQDPYPTPGHPVGLSFSVGPDVRPLPRSLANIFTELQADLGIAPSPSGNLGPWATQGVLLLNRVLTVRPGAPASHRGKGWEAVTEQAIRALVARDRPLVAILWGRDAQGLKPMLGATPTIESAHPSPLSAYRGFFGSRPFSRANELLATQGALPVQWSLTPLG